MISFESDYNNGAHPKVLQHIIDTNNTNSKSYGYDDWSENAKKKINIDIFVFDINTPAYNSLNIN